MGFRGVEFFLSGLFGVVPWLLLPPEKTYSTNQITMIIVLLLLCVICVFVTDHNFSATRRGTRKKLHGTRAHQGKANKCMHGQTELDLLVRGDGLRALFMPDHIKT